MNITSTKIRFWCKLANLALKAEHACNAFNRFCLRKSLDVIKKNPVASEAFVVAIKNGDNDYWKEAVVRAENESS